MHGFDLEQLRTLVAAVDAGSLSAAAPVRSLSQSSLSEQLRKLEERSGQTLLLRGKSGVRPTAAGERLVAYARRILALSDEAWRELHDVPSGGELRIGITDYFRPADLVRMLARLGQQYPSLRLRTHAGKSDDIEAAHRRGEFDLSIVLRLPDSHGRSGDTPVVRLRGEPLHWVAAPSAAPLRAGEPVPLALLPESCSLHRLARSRLDAQRIPYVVTHVASGVAGLRAAVAAGLGVGCLNASSLDRDTMVPLHVPALPPLPDATFVLLPRASGHGTDDSRETAMEETARQAMTDAVTQALLA